MNLFMTGSDVLAMALHTLADHLADKYRGHATRRSARTACIDLTDLDAEQIAVLSEEVQHVAQDLRFDFALLRADHCWDSYSVLASDMDSTLITIECIDEIADFCGKKAEVAVITEAAMRGEIRDFAESLKRRVALLAGTPESVLQSVYDERLRLTPGAVELIKAAQSHQLHTLLVSGGFTFFTDRLKARLGIDEAHSNTLGIAEGKLTGQVEGTVFGAEAKRAALSQMCSSLAVPVSRAIAIGDGANDLPMMRVAGLSVAFHAKPSVVASADIAIRYGGLDVLVDWL